MSGILNEIDHAILFEDVFVSFVYILAFITVAFNLPEYTHI